MDKVPSLTSAALIKRIWNDDTFSSLAIMGMRGGMLVAKFALSIFIARYMGLEELGIYGLVVAASSTMQAVMRGGVFSLVSRDAVNQPLHELTHHLRHYGIGIAAIYIGLIPIAYAAGLYFDATHLALLILAVILTDHLAFDSFVLANNLQYPKLANFIYSLQSASWIYLFVILAFLHPALRTMETMLSFWIGGGVITTILVIYSSRRWPWREALKRELEWQWYPGKIKNAFNLYLTEVCGVLTYYLDRYIVTIFLSLEMTGIYVFFSQVVTATWNLINSGVMVIYRPRLINAFNKGKMKLFDNLFRECLQRTFFSTTALAIIAAIAVPFLARFTEKEALLLHLPLLWAMLGALFFQIGANAAEGGLYAMQKDRQMFIATFLNCCMSAVFGSLAVLLLGVYGIVANTVFVCTIVIFYARSQWSKTPPGANEEDEAKTQNAATANSNSPDQEKEKKRYA